MIPIPEAPPKRVGKVSSSVTDISNGVECNESNYLFLPPASSLGPKMKKFAPAFQLHIVVDNKNAVLSLRNARIRRLPGASNAWHPVSHEKHAKRCVDHDRSVVTRSQ